MTLFNCSVGRLDCSRCRTAEPKYGCVWCDGAASSRCVYQDSCTDEIKHTCPAPIIHDVRLCACVCVCVCVCVSALCVPTHCLSSVLQLDPVSGPVEGGTVVTISGSNLGQRAEDIQNSVTVAGVPCSVIHSRYEVSSRQVQDTPGHTESDSK